MSVVVPAAYDDKLSLLPVVRLRVAKLDIKNWCEAQKRFLDRYVGLVWVSLMLSPNFKDK